MRNTKTSKLDFCCSVRLCFTLPKILGCKKIALAKLELSPKILKAGSSSSEAKGNCSKEQWPDDV